VSDPRLDEPDSGSLVAEAAPLEEPCPDLPFVQDPKDRIRALPRAYDPAEKMLARGPSSLSHGELLALVLGTRRGAAPVARVAERLLRRHGLQGLARVRPGELNREPGVGPAAAARISAVFELGRRIHGKDPHEARPRLTKPREVFERVRGMARARKEHLVGLYLDAQNGLVHRETLSVGSLNTTRTHPREILYPAIVHLALGFILVHNHPSGSLEPSPEDLEFTRGVQRAGELMGIELYDHLIVARSGYASLREMGML